MTYNDLQYYIRRLQITGRGYKVPLVISMFIHEILTYSKNSRPSLQQSDFDYQWEGKIMYYERLPDLISEPLKAEEVE